MTTDLTATYTELLAEHVFTLYPDALACDCDWSTREGRDEERIGAWTAHVAAVLANEGEAPILGHVQQARWGEWEAACSAPRCGWRHSQGNRTQEDAEKHMRGHAAICHSPRIPVRAAAPRGA